MNGKRVTIYHIAKELGMSGSYVSRALNNHPSVSDKIKEQVKKKAHELNYKHNSHAANLRQGSSKTIGVIVPRINQSFFSEAIAGIEEACFENNHTLVICQSHESYKHETLAINTLIHQNVDCILISISSETKTTVNLEEVIDNRIELIQFDRFLDFEGSYRVSNDNKEASCEVVRNLVSEGYRKIAFIGGPDHLSVFKERKEGYLSAIQEAGLSIPENFIIDNVLPREAATKAANHLLSLKKRPDAIFTVSDHQSLGVMEVARSLGIKVPTELGIFGFANEAFDDLLQPRLSSVNQRSKELGKAAANMYFKNILQGDVLTGTDKTKIVQSEIVIRDSSRKSFSPALNGTVTAVK